MSSLDSTLVTLLPVAYLYSTFIPPFYHSLPAWFLHVPTDALCLTSRSDLAFPGYLTALLLPTLVSTIAVLLVLHYSLLFLFYTCLLVPILL